MSNPHDPDFTRATDIGAPKGPRLPSGPRPAFDLDNADEVFALALRVATGNRRCSEWLTIAETRAIARLAVAGWFNGDLSKVLKA